MQPPVEFLDRSAFKERMNRLLELDPARTVVLTVDMQRAYLDATVATSPAPPDECARVLRHSRELLDFARAEGLPVIHVYVQRRQVELDHGFYYSGTQFALLGERGELSQNVNVGFARKDDRPEGSPQAEVPAELVRPGDVHVTTKKTTDGFFGTELEVLLSRVYRADAVVLTGVNTDTCVYATTQAASIRGYKPIVISDCVASTRGKDQHWMALELMSRSIAWVLTVDELKAKIRAGKVKKE